MADAKGVITFRAEMIWSNDSGNLDICSVGMLFLPILHSAMAVACTTSIREMGRNSKTNMWAGAGIEGR